MNTHILLRRLSPVFLGLFLLTSFPGSSVSAAEISRANTWEITALGNLLSSSSNTIAVGSLRATSEFEHVRGGGAAIGYNLSNNFGVHAYLTGGTASFKVKIAGGSGSEDLTILDSGVSADWNMLSGAFTPVLSAHAGWMNFSGGGTTGSESDFAYGLSAGVRYDFSRHWFGKAVYRLSFTKFEGYDERTRFGGLSVGLGYRF